jgi:hypothetical protein
VLERHQTGDIAVILEVPLGETPEIEVGRDFRELQTNSATLLPPP